MDSSSPPPFTVPAEPTTRPNLRFSDGAWTARPAQPYPTRASVNHFRLGDCTVTAIYRQWPPGHSGPGGGCRLCPGCTASGDACHIQVPFHVPPEAVPLFAVADLPNPVRQDVLAG